MDMSGLLRWFEPYGPGYLHGDIIWQIGKYQFRERPALYRCHHSDRTTTFDPVAYFCDEEAARQFQAFVEQAIAQEEAA